MIQKISLFLKKVHIQMFFRKAVKEFAQLNAAPQIIPGSRLVFSVNFSCFTVKIQRKLGVMEVQQLLLDESSEN